MKKIKNFDTLASSALRRHALEIAEAGYEAIDTPAVIQNHVRLNGDTLSINDQDISLASVGRVFVVGIGKCSLKAGTALQKVLGGRIEGGIVFDIEEGEIPGFQVYAGDHPYSTERNRGITKEIITLLRQTTEQDLVLFIISGGGSALLCQPEKHKCEDEDALIKAMFRGGATIQELNIVRKHLSLARGGWLASYAYPARVVSLLFSDVPGDDMHVISSGPTIKDESTVDDAKHMLEKFHIPQYESILVETPKEEKFFERVTNILFVSNKLALTAMQEKAKELGYAATVKTAQLQGEAREVGKTILRELRAAEPKTALLYGGETTVTIAVHGGKGGRSLELALSPVNDVKEGEVLIAFASDGRDNTEFAGGICDILTKEHARQHNIRAADAMQNNASFDFFDKTGDYIDTGDTGSNVSDLVVALKE